MQDDGVTAVVRWERVAHSKQTGGCLLVKRQAAAGPRTLTVDL